MMIPLKPNWTEQKFNEFIAQKVHEQLPSSDDFLSSSFVQSSAFNTLTYYQVDEISSIIKKTAVDDISDENAEDTEVVEDTQDIIEPPQDAESVAAEPVEQMQYANPNNIAMPDPYTIRDGWDSDYFIVDFSDEAIVESVPRNLGLFAPKVAYKEHYTEVRLETQSDSSIICDCDVSGYWTLLIDHFDFDSGEEEGPGFVEGMLSSWSIDFGNGQIYTNDSGLSWSQEFFYFDVSEIFIDGICNTQISDIKVTLELEILEHDNLYIWLQTPTGHVIDLFFNSFDQDIGLEGTYMFSDNASVHIEDAPIDEGDFVEEGTYLTSGETSAIPELGVWTSFEDLVANICEEIDEFSGSAAAPIVLDMLNDGLELLALEDSNVMFDMDNDGELENTAWFGPNEGILVFDLFSDNQVTNVNEFAFANWHPHAQTDLEGLQLAFDTNQDGTLNAQDESWSELAIWQDKNQNGISDEGEFLSLESLGIISISLSSDGNLHMNNGSTVYGIIDVNRSDGTSLQAGDVALPFAQATAEVSAPPSPNSNDLPAPDTGDGSIM